MMVQAWTFLPAGVNGSGELRSIARLSTPFEKCCSVEFSRLQRIGWVAVVITALVAPWASVRGDEVPKGEHRIGVRVVGGTSEFYDRASGTKFVPRGNNYVRLIPLRDASGNERASHATFDAGRYDAERMDQALAHMHADGYNMVRMFLSEDSMGDQRLGLSPAYLKNVADALERAKSNGMFVFFTFQWLPKSRKYASLLQPDCCDRFSFSNLYMLSPGGVNAEKSFFDDFIAGLRALGAPMDAIFAYELRNEVFFEEDHTPLTLTSGTITTANGKAYDMADAAQKQRMIDENLVFWIDEERAEILAKDPTALVGVGFFAPQLPNAFRVKDTRYVSSRPAIWNSHADFIDLHAYPGRNLTLAQYSENFGMKGNPPRPVIMGEFGATTDTYPGAKAAANGLVAWQRESCRQGYSGWILWTWDSDEQERFFNGMRDGGIIEKALAPATRPDPCS